MHVVVVGAGAFGTWTALWLLRRGASVTLVEQYGPGNSLSSSGDESRVTRSAHGPDDHYPLWQRRSLGSAISLVRRATGTSLSEPTRSGARSTRRACTWRSQHYRPLAAHRRRGRRSPR